MRSKISSAIAILVFVIIGSANINAASQANEGGTWHDLSFGRIFVPDHLNLKNGHIDMLVHFHGSPRVVTRAVNKQQLNVAVVAVTLNGLSSAYKRPFTDDTDLFDRVLLEGLMCVKEVSAGGKELRIGRIGLSSFSAGFGAVREILKDSRYYQQIQSILMADSIYAGYVKDGEKNVVNPNHMKDFRRFAKDAARGRKRFIVTHSYLAPDGYAGTHETADDLVAAVRKEREQVREELAENHVMISRLATGDLLVIGVEGNDGKAHGLHLMHMGMWLGEMGFETLAESTN
ncbi:hypothetical protein [Poriferisphaera sp. WC338]|uniref:hypothetical protein n=1 Tax=Poriferisphaera sp. WC338 TaxID=3425129 RepID=UPI003D8141EC